MTDKSPLILLVEDEAAHAALIQRAFENEPEPVSLVIATNLQAARGYLASLTPDLLIVDFLLPDGRGTELLPADREQGLSRRHSDQSWG